jgi:hypothetical protein
VGGINSGEKVLITPWGMRREADLYYLYQPFHPQQRILKESTLNLVTSIRGYIIKGQEYLEIDNGGKPQTQVHL